MEGKLIVAIAFILTAILGGLILAAVAWGNYVNRNADPTTQIVPLQSPVTFGYQCADFQCSDGLECDATRGICLLSNGSVCDLGSECLSTAYCSGICVDFESTPPAVVTNATNDPCPCPQGMGCVSIPNNPLRICRGQNRFPCSDGSDCISEVCVSGQCTAGLPNGAPCTSDSQCASTSKCSSSSIFGSYCQSTGVTTGQEGAVCEGGSPGCEPGLSCTNNVCASSTNGLQSTCDSTSPCSAPLVCRNNSFTECTDGETCYCSYPYTNQRPDPNSCSQTGACTTGYACTNEVCIADDASIPCFSNGQCASESCSSTGGIFQISFIYYDTTTDQNVTSPNLADIVGSFSITMIKESSGFLPNNVKRITGFSLSGVDTLFYVVPGDKVNPSRSGVINSQGNNIISGYTNTSTSSNSVVTQTERLLIDAVIYASETGLVAYNETVTTFSDPPVVKSNYTMYIYNSGTLTPFNPSSSQPGIPGTQYSGSSPLSIQWIDRSDEQGVIILDNSNTIYVKGASETSYSKLRISTSGEAITGAHRPQFYSGSPEPSVAYIGSYSSQNSLGTTPRGDVIQFVGENLGSVYPLYSNTDDAYTVVDYSIFGSGSTQFMIYIAVNNTNNLTNLFIVPGNGNEPFPTYVNSLNRVFATENGVYVYTPLTCD